MTQEILNGAAKTGGITDTSLRMVQGFNQIKDSINGIKIEVGYNNQGQAYLMRKDHETVIFANYYKA